MRDIQPPKFNQKKKRLTVRKLYSKPTLLFLVVIAVLLAKSTWGIYQKEAESRDNIAMVKAELDALNQRKALLVTETEKLKTEEGVEDAIREKFQVSKQGEQVLVVVDKPLPAPEDDKDKGFFGRLWKSMSGMFEGESTE